MIMPLLVPKSRLSKGINISDSKTICDKMLGSKVETPTQHAKHLNEQMKKLEDHIGDTVMVMYCVRPYGDDATSKPMVAKGKLTAVDKFENITLSVRGDDLQISFEDNGSRAAITRIWTVDKDTKKTEVLYASK